MYCVTVFIRSQCDCCIKDCGGEPEESEQGLDGLSGREITLHKDTLHSIYILYPFNEEKEGRVSLHQSHTSEPVTT